MRSWLAKSSSKEVKEKTSKEGFFDAIQRRFKSGLVDKKSGKSKGVEFFSYDLRSEKAPSLSVSLSPSVEVSRCQSFAEERPAQPLPLPVHLTRVGCTDSGVRKSHLELSLSLPSGVYDRSKPCTPDGWIELTNVSVTSNSSMDTNDQPDSRLFSPQASDYESGNVTAINSPSRPWDRSPLIARRLSRDQEKSVHSPNDFASTRRRPLSSHVPKLQIPPRDGFIAASESCTPSPSRSPLRNCTQEQLNKLGLSVRRTCSDMYSPACGPSGKKPVHDTVADISSPVQPQNRCSAECSPLRSPRMTSPCCRPLVPSAGGLCKDDGRPQSHKLPLPPVPFSSSFSKISGQGESSTSPVSRWKKGRLIGSGTFGQVYLGFSSETGVMCAMKEVILFSDDPKSKECAQQLEQEITLLSDLRHPNIVQYFGSETVEDKLHIYLEYVSGGSIHKLLKDYGQLGELAIRSFTRQILSGLTYLHARNTVHRDIKGANILVDPSGRVKLADFGMAKHITGQSGPLSFKGSPYWMAPEVIRNSKGSNLAVDIWSLGCTVIEMATAKPPWSEYEGVAALFKVGNSKEIPPIPDHLSREGRDFVLKCLQRNPLDRPTAAQLLDHPFVKNVASSGRCLLPSEPSEPLHEISVNSSSRMKKLAGLDLEGVTMQLSKGVKFKTESSIRSTPKHLSCPASPVKRPLTSSKLSQTPPFRTRPPFLTQPQTVSGPTTPYNSGNRTHLNRSTLYSPEGIHTKTRQKSLYAKVDLQSKQQCTTVMAQSEASGSKIQTLVHAIGESYNPQSVIDQMSAKLFQDHLKPNQSPHVSSLKRPECQQ